MNWKIIVIMMMLLVVGLSGCEEEDIKSICDETKATPILVELQIVFSFNTDTRNFDKVDTNKPSIWWFSKNINKCGEGVIDYTYHEKDATYENLGYQKCKFPNVPVYVDNELDEVYIEGGLNHGGSTFYTSKHLSYSELKPYAGSIYDLVLFVAQEISNIVAPAIYVFIQSSDEAYFGNQNIRINIVTQGGEFTYYRKTLLPDGYTEKIYLNPIDFSNPENYITITATHQGTGNSAQGVISDAEKYASDYYYDFEIGKYVIEKLITINI